MRISEFWKPVLISLVLTPICLFLAAVSAGAGHGNYLVAKILFPFTLLSTLVFNSITVPSIVLAIIQFPLYGLILGVASKQGRFRSIAMALTIVHSLVAVFSLLLLSENFS